MTGVLQPQTRHGSTLLRRERRARGECILGDGRRIFKGGRCRTCYAKHRGAVNASYEKRAPRGREVTGWDYLRFRAAVVRDNKQWRTRNPDRYRALVAAETERRIKACGWYRILEVNEPPPGWSPEYDRREELQALSELTALRKVS